MRFHFGNLIANVLGHAFLRHCRRELCELTPDSEPVAARIREHAQRVFDARKATMPDPQARMIYVYCSLVLAAFREARAVTGDDARAYAFARTVFRQTLARPLRWMPRLWLRFARDPVGFLNRHSFAGWLQRNQGVSMEYVDEKMGDTVDLVVRRCGFHQFFVDHGEPALTPVVCELDRVWMDVIDRSPRPLRTERPTTISTGGDCCRFRFIRDDDKRNVEPTDVVLVQLQKRPYVG